MFLRYFLVLCLIAFAFSAIYVHAKEEEEDVDKEIENIELEDRANIVITVVKSILGSTFAGAAASCLTEAVAHCKSFWKNPGKALKCGKNFLVANKGRCLLG